VGWVDGGGGISPDHYAIPSWQQLSGVINSSNKGSTVYRNGPDVSANANFTFYVCADQTTCTANEYGGTSFAAPMWAGYLALANQQAVTNGVAAPGFIDPVIYPLNLGNSDADFHDIVSGSDGLPTTVGYDLATGWGSPNGSLLINALTGPAGPNFTLSANPTSVTIKQGASGTSTITITPVDGFSGSVTLADSGLPSGVTAGFSPNPATTTSTLTLTASATATTGTVTVTITGTSGSLTNTTTLSLTVNSSSSGPVVTLNPTSLKWGKIVVGTTSGAKPVTLTNSGTGTLNISTIAVSGDFALKVVKATKTVTPCVNGTALAAGATCEFKVTFTPTQTGVRTGAVSITDNAPGSPQQVALTGTGK
jgi:kumamolisin